MVQGPARMDDTPDDTAFICTHCGARLTTYYLATYACSQCRRHAVKPYEEGMEIIATRLAKLNAIEQTE